MGRFEGAPHKRSRAGEHHANIDCIVCGRQGWAWCSHTHAVALWLPFISLGLALLGPWANSPHF